MELKFRTLNANELECRVGATSKKDGVVKSFSLLLYKTARVDQVVLDETVGAFNWAKKYYQVKNTMMCSIGIKDKDTGEWVWKDDAGDDDFQTEQVKGEASDSFKRAGFCWGIGRELYYAPKIWVKCDDENNEKGYYSVNSISYDSNKNITELTIVNSKTGQVVYSYGKQPKVAKTSEKTQKFEELDRVEEPKTDPLAKYNNNMGTIRDKELDKINNFIVNSDKDRVARFKVWLEQRYGTDSVIRLSERQGIEVCKLMNI